MKKPKLAGWVIGAVLFFVALAAVDQMLKPKPGSPAPVSSTGTPSAGTTIAPVPALTPASVEVTNPGFIYGRITANDGVVYEGRLRWGGNEEAFWGDGFNGAKDKNVWIAHVPPERLPKQQSGTKILGIELGEGDRTADVGRLFMVRFGDIARVAPRGREVLVTLKSGTVFVLDRNSASDFDDDVRVWDGKRGEVALDSRQVRSVEFMTTGKLGEVPGRLHGTVKTTQGDFTGFIQWNRATCLGSDELEGRTTEGPRSLRFDTIRTIARRADSGALVTLADGSELELAGSTRDVGRGNRGIYVEDNRYGRVLISWEVFERVDFSPGGSGPGYRDFPPGRPLSGSVTTRDGRRLTGRLVYDLDESETAESFDAPVEGIDYSIPFGMVASIVPPAREVRGKPLARVTLHNGETLQLELDGDVGDTNAGILIFVEGREHPEYVAWSEVQQVDFDRPPAMYPPLGGS